MRQYHQRVFSPSYKRRSTCESQSPSSCIDLAPVVLMHWSPSSNSASYAQLMMLSRQERRESHADASSGPVQWTVAAVGPEAPEVRQLVVGSTVDERTWACHLDLTLKVVDAAVEL